jgi:predicted lipoprotein with Yx(FWY)xxD motif
MTGTRRIGLVSLIVACAIATSMLAAMAAMVGTPSAMPTFQKGVLTDEHGMTLYVFAKDTAGTSNCYDACARLWPPSLAPSGATPSGHFSTVARKDGANQWAYDGQPLYLFSNDTAPGQQNGDGFKGLWKVIKTPTP